MTTTILIPSSSPPPSFARSPTPAIISSPILPSPYTILHPDDNRSKVSKSKRQDTTKADRHKHTDTEAAKRLSAKRTGSENIPIGLHRDKLDADLLKKHSNQEPSLQVSGQDSDLKTQNAKPSKRAADKVDQVKQSKLAGSHLLPGLLRLEQVITAQDQAINVQGIQAVARRCDWTPPKETKEPHDAQGDTPKVSFSDLTGGFSFAGGMKNILGADLKGASEEQGPTKRRRLDLLSTTSVKEAAPQGSKKSDLSRRTTHIKRSKSPKKLTTITARATADSIQIEEPGGLMQYFSKGEESVEISKKPKRTTKKTSKTVTAGKKKLPPRAPASPNSAIQTFQEQDLIFGSASQLERDESPTLTRDTLKAIKESEEASLNARSPVPVSTGDAALTPFNNSTRRLATIRKSRNLWAAAGRDEDGSLLSLETLELLDTPAVRQALADPPVPLPPELGKKPLLDGEEPRNSTRTRGGWLDLDADFDVRTPIAKRLNPAQQIRAVHTQVQNCAASKSEDAVNEPNKFNPAPKIAENAVRSFDPCDRPSFTGFTNEQLSAKLASYGFKPIKKREKMIQTLERCWEDQQKLNVEPEEPEPPTAPTHAAALDAIHGLAERPAPRIPKKGRPKKINDEKLKKAPAEKKPRAKRKKKAETSTEKTPKRKRKAPSVAKEEMTPEREPDTKYSFPSAKPLEDIDDSSIEIPLADINHSQSAPLPTKESLKPQSLDPQIPESPQPPSLEVLPISSTTTSPPLSPSPSSPLSPIADSITRAILHRPPSTTTSNQLASTQPHNSVTSPTWHEKILMYDPIELEELTIWLNTEGLGAVGEDREVGPLEVREWCERRGVCCFWGWGGPGGRGWRKGR
ncbi:MAG: hypothetical protein Q9160_007873 [Pyrenula sp. 1 TL-2023]